MGNYNPSAPQILGNEWVGIRDEDLSFSPAVNAFEVGHGFTLATARQVGDARFYIHEFAPGNSQGQVYMAAVYPQGQEDNSGPVQRVIIPCNSGTISGSGGSSLNGTTFAAAVADPSDGNYISLQMGGTPIPGGFDAYFATNQYANQLTGKRILGVNILYGASTGGVVDDVLAVTPAIYEVISNGTTNYAYFGMLTANDPTAIAMTEEGIRADRLYRVALGEVDNFWSTTLSPFSTSERLPWTYTALQRFEVGNANRRSFRWISVAASGAVEIQLHYLAMEILYCEEQRLAVGARAYGTYSASPAALTPYTLGTNIIPMRTIAQVANPVLPAAAYTVVVSSADVGDVYGPGTGLRVKTGKYPILNALRELYAIPPHPGLEIDLPFPKTPAIVGRTFTSETTHVLPQLSLHTTGGSVLTEPHVYGRQAAAPVYGASALVTQGIINSAFGATPTSYPQVRFWARRFGDTTQPLVFKTQSGLPVITANITVADFDLLPEILDGWKEVNLTFTAGSPTPSFVAGGTVTTYEWSSTAETVGNRWEVLGVTAPAISGIPGNLLNTVPTGQVLDSATYGGAGAFMTWQYPNASAASADTTSDASVLFSQAMPAVSGLAVTLSSQAVSGIGLNCGLPPGCIPSGIGFHTVSWTSLSAAYGASSAPISGFGYYELQRMDTIDTWATIAQISTVASTSFYDYEPRVGIVSSYRIRGCDLYGFCGLWSSTVTATLPTPGVYGTDGNGVLIFTANEQQDGALNLAYTQQWETNNPEEQFDFPEAGYVKLQEFYGRDFVTAFRPTERGGERFDATLLVQAAAVSAPVLENVFHSLRDMAWADVTQICVRNELGDRWFATVLVPDGRVKRNRRLQLVRVQIIEVADTPCVVEL